MQKEIKKIIRGIVQPGNKQGRKMGAPTINLPLSAAKNLEKGLYACTAKIDDSVVRGLLYYGINSLTHEDCLEVHLFSFADDIYGTEVTVAVGTFIRPPMEFSSEEDLKKQIAEDIQRAQEDFGATP